MTTSTKDVVRTSPYIKVDFEESKESNYESFTKAVAMAVDSAERQKCNYESFFEAIQRFIKRYNIPAHPFISFTNKDITKIDYEGFSCNVAMIVNNLGIESSALAFNKINNLMERYNIERHIAPKPEYYGGKLLKKDWK